MQEVLETKENEDEKDFGPQYPAYLYTTRPNDTALLSPLYDWTFKKIFTQGTDESYLALQSFISAVLGRKVVSVKLKPNELPKETDEQKSITFDVTAEFDNGEISDIEIQAHKEKYDYGIRAEVHAARLFSNNAKKGSIWAASKVYQISVLNFHYEKDDNKEMSWYTMKEKNGKELAERLNIIFIDLVSIRQKAGLSVEELTPVEKWGLFLSFVDKEKRIDYVKKLVKSEEGLMAAESIIKYMSQEDANWFTQNSIDTFQRDHNTLMSIAHEEGLQQGLQQKAIEAAQNALSMQLPAETASKISGLPIEKVLELQAQLLAQA